MKKALDPLLLKPLKLGEIKPKNPKPITKTVKEIELIPYGCLMLG